MDKQISIRSSFAAASAPLSPNNARRARPPRPRRWGGWVLAALLLILAADRFSLLDRQAFHHDESIHCYYSWLLGYQGPSTYEYDPVYHGPFLYHFGGLFHRFLPDTEAWARFPFALMGFLLGAAFLLWRRALGWGTCALVVGLLTLSPIVAYFSRFAREDAHQMMWLTGILVTGVLYLRTARVAWLTGSVFFLTMSYCTKENSYVNHFALCAFPVLWGAARWVRRGREGTREILVRYFPLVRFFTLFGCFSAAVFFYVAVDCRVGPDTSLSSGLKQIVANSTAISEKPDRAAFEGQSGYFTDPGREGVRQTYILLTACFTLGLLSLFEAVSIGYERRPSALQMAGLACWALFFYLLLALCVFSLAHWVASAPARHAFPLALTRQVMARAAILLTAPVLALGSDLIFHPRTRNADGSARSFFGLIDSWRERLFGIWGLTTQVLLAMFLYLLLFGSLGWNLREGPTTGLYDYIAYWFKHQTGEFRLWDEWWYYLPRLALFEAFPLALCGVLAVAEVWERLIKKQPFGAPLQGANQTETTVPWVPSGHPRLLKGGPCRGRGCPPFQRVSPALLGFLGYLTIFFVAVYAILNEKVPWLATYQAYALNLLAALWAGDWLARHWGFWRGGRLGRVLATGALGLFVTLGVAYTIYQHALQVFVRSDNPSELLVYAATTHEFGDFSHRIIEKQQAAQAQGETYAISLQGNAQWPSAWYLRNADVAWNQMNLGADVVIADDTPENERLLQYGDQEWAIEPMNLRAWWLTAGSTALPDTSSLWENLKAFLTNAPNDQRSLFEEIGESAPENYPLGFRDQVLNYVFLRRIWAPTGGHRLLACERTGRAQSPESSPGYLAGAGEPAEPVAVATTTGSRGSNRSQLQEPRGLAVTPEGNLVVMDSQNGRIQVFDPNGACLLEFGSGVLGINYSGACDVACDTAGNFFVADTWNHSVRKFSPEGRLLATADSALADDERVTMFGPRGIAVGLDGRVYVADTGRRRVRIFENDLTPVDSWGVSGTVPGGLLEPVGIAVDAQGRVCVADAGTGRLMRFTAQGRLLWLGDFVKLSQKEIYALEPHLDALPDGRLAVTASLMGAVWIVEPELMRVTILNLVNPAIEDPVGLVATPDGQIWVSDRTLGLVARFRPPEPKPLTETDASGGDAGDADVTSETLNFDSETSESEPGV